MTTIDEVELTDQQWQRVYDYLFCQNSPYAERDDAAAVAAELMQGCCDNCRDTEQWLYKIGLSAWSISVLSLAVIGTGPLADWAKQHDLPIGV